MVTPADSHLRSFYYHFQDQLEGSVETGTEVQSHTEEVGAWNYNSAGDGARGQVCERSHDEKIYATVFFLIFIDSFDVICEKEKFWLVNDCGEGSATYWGVGTR